MIVCNQKYYKKLKEGYLDYLSLSLSFFIIGIFFSEKSVKIPFQKKKIFPTLKSEKVIQN